MPVPQLTAEQRKKALAKSLEARKKRAELKADLKAGKLTVEKVLLEAKTDVIKGKIKVLSLLTTQSGVGKVKALDILKKAGIPETRRAAGLGSKQLDTLLKLIK
ncbi:MAG: integration host factor [Bifidobacteriaceae bacterium]|jgi:hypothetical protein|nr:integration host factor [Bifidobacteriaceae bacterium]